MPKLVVRHVPQAIVERLRQRAFKAGVTVEECHRLLLLRALVEDDKSVEDLIAAFRAMGEPGIDLDTPVAEGPERQPPSF